MTRWLFCIHAFSSLRIPPYWQKKCFGWIVKCVSFLSSDISIMEWHLRELSDADSYKWHELQRNNKKPLEFQTILHFTSNQFPGKSNNLTFIIEHFQVEVSLKYSEFKVKVFIYLLYEHLLVRQFQKEEVFQEMYLHKCVCYFKTLIWYSAVWHSHCAEDISQLSIFHCENMNFQMLIKCNTSSSSCRSIQITPMFRF